MTTIRSVTREEWPLSEGPAALPVGLVPDATKASASRRRSCLHFCNTPKHIMSYLSFGLKV